MSDTHPYNTFRFDRPTLLPSRRIIPILVILILFTLLWKAVPHSALYWLLTPLYAILGWMATYGWRQALANLIVFLNRLEQF